MRIDFVLFLISRTHRAVHVVVRATALAAVGFVDDHRKALVAEVGDSFDDERELLDRGDDDLLAILQRRFQVGRAQRGGDDVLDLGEIPDVLAQLLVQKPPVGHDDHAVEQRLVQPLGTRDACFGRIGLDQLIGRPGDRV